MTLTPDDATEILRQCPAITDVAPIVRARSKRMPVAEPPMSAQSVLANGENRRGGGMSQSEGAYCNKGSNSAVDFRAFCPFTQLEAGFRQNV